MRIIFSMSFVTAMIFIFAVTFTSNAQTFTNDSFAETEWVGADTDPDDVTTFRFEKGGVVSYSYDGNSFRNGTWKLEGDTLTFELNKGFRLFKGSVTKNKISGTSTNNYKEEWISTFYLYSPPLCDRRFFDISTACRPPIKTKANKRSSTKASAKPRKIKPRR